VEKYVVGKNRKYKRIKNNCEVTENSFVKKDWKTKKDGNHRGLVDCAGGRKNRKLIRNYS
jgi:hypothetical protein